MTGSRNDFLMSQFEVRKNVRKEWEEGSIFPRARGCVLIAGLPERLHRTVYASATINLLQHSLLPTAELSVPSQHGGKHHLTG